ncbi:probable LRR receptor-like serine/threonine-protein kinase RFK1 isoform X1 [Mangifera indica]|uniref:probable LRR receptor-like serine/threonine-protein kinase RFK1 isoform X1 n=1 Tax=Mangifera indica TaxID=29780 RepID=UPI001CFB47AA|nr:probable LRR receptor-like serine/threonine-protein kinase RFK1 isoform X1 [Mangifera indica]
MFFKHLLVVSILSLCFVVKQLYVDAKLPQSEVDVLNQIAKTMGPTNWTFDADTACEIHEKSPVTEVTKNISCILDSDGSSHHISVIEFKRCDLSGVLPPELNQLPNISKVDFAYNYLNGSIPVEWASMELNFISLFGNRLSGNIPSHLGDITSLTYLDIEANQFSGTVPTQLGKLVNLETLRLSSNRLTGNLPNEFSQLTNMTNFRINDNNFNGSIPEFIQNWSQLERLEILGSGLKGPIPSSISLLENLQQLKISDIDGTNQAFPDLSKNTHLRRLTLRNCHISGEIPKYIWGMNNLRVLDLSFNKLTGELPNVPIPKDLLFIFLTGNFLRGDIPESLLVKGSNVDLSYNNFSQPTSEHPACQRMQSQELNLNLFRSYSAANNLSGFLPCKTNQKCHRYWRSFYIDCGGSNVKENGSTFEGDGEVEGGAATYYSNDHWGFSSTGDFSDDNNEQNKKYVVEHVLSSDISKLFINARKAPLSLTYFGYCLKNGNYVVSLDFAEIQFTNDNKYGSLGRRMFDSYVQDKQVEKDFNIEAEASGILKPVTRKYNATVTDNVLEIRFYWAGKGTTAHPVRGVYGPLVSAISVMDPTYKPAEKIAGIIAGVVVGSCLIILALGILAWRYYSRIRRRKGNDVLEGSNLKTISFTLKQIKAATNNFDPENKIGEGGFGPVYKGQLSDGTIIAVKQLSSKSKQGNREFLNEIAIISCLHHQNLVKLHGCCIEGDQLLLVYEYMENNSLARALFGHENCQLKLDWPTRQKICIGIARGLVFLHEESRFKIVHRDIKATNVLLDKDLNPKISDFGLAKLDEEEKTHISTRVAGTIGYMAPEYALWGYLTDKADVYSFGIVALEIVSGRDNKSSGPAEDCSCLLDWACKLQQEKKIMELVDPKLGSEYNKEEAERMIRTSLVCTNASPSLRPAMSEAVSMLEGKTAIPDFTPEVGSHSQDLRFKAIRDFHELNRSQTQHPTPPQDLYTIDDESYLRYKFATDGNSDVLLSASTPSRSGSSNINTSV